MNNSIYRDIKQQLEYERIILNVAKNFIRSDTTNLAIQEALKQICLINNASRAYIFEFHDDNIFMSNTYEWCNEGIEPEIWNLKNLPIDMFPWWMNALKSGNILNIGDVSQLPEEASAEREILEFQNILSVLVLPLEYDGKLKGFIGFDHCNAKNIWQSFDETLLSILAELFNNAFTRRAQDQRLCQRNVQLNEVVNELKTAQLQLISQEKMVAIGQLAAGVAHEINNPLSFVTSNTETLGEYLTTLLGYLKKEHISSKEIRFIESDHPKLLSDTLEGLKRVKNITESLRNFSNIDSAEETGLYDFSEGIETTLTLLDSRIKDLYELDFEQIGVVPPLNGNVNKLNQVIMNLLVNALDAIDEKNQDTGKISIRLSHNADFLELEIEDNGSGIAPENLEQIFNPFFSTKDVGKGTGVGLSVAYDIIVNQHKGNIDIQSEVGVGTRVKVTLPL